MEELRNGARVSQKPQRKTIKIGCFEIDVTVANIFFSILAIVGQVGENVSLPLWIDSTRRSNYDEHSNGTHLSNVTVSTNNTSEFAAGVDGYFVLSFASASFVVIFGTALIFIRVFQPHRLGETERTFPHFQMFLAGFFEGISGIFTVFASSGARTAPYLQAILGNIMIPITIICRYFILRKTPTIRKFLCAMVVMFSLFICLIPKIIPLIDSEAESTTGASGVGGILWPICFMFGAVPEAVFFVVGERNLKMELTSAKRRVNLIYYLFWSTFYQFITVLCLFWTNIVPEFGYVDNINHFWGNWSFGFQCFFGGAGCGPACFVRGTTFIGMYAITFIGGGLLMRFSEGATFFAVVSTAVTPLGFLFWSLFRETPFGFHPTVHLTTWFSIAGLVPMVPAIFMYNTGHEEYIQNEVAPEESLLLSNNGSIYDYGFNEPCNTFK